MLKFVTDINDLIRVNIDVRVHAYWSTIGVYKLQKQYIFFLNVGRISSPHYSTVIIITCYSLKNQSPLQTVYSIYYIILLLKVKSQRWYWKMKIAQYTFMFRLAEIFHLILNWDIGLLYYNRMKVFIDSFKLVSLINYNWPQYEIFCNVTTS